MTTIDKVHCKHFRPGFLTHCIFYGVFIYLVNSSVNCVSYFMAD